MKTKKGSLLEMLDIYRYGTEEFNRRLEKILSRSTDFDEKIVKDVGEIIKKVKIHGDSALIEYTRQFDCKTFTKGMIFVSNDEIEEAYSLVNKDYMSAIQCAIENIREFHKRQLQPSWFMTRDDGVIMGQRVEPVERAGVYVPGGKGGKTPLVSSVIMGVIPAKVAGVKEVYVVTPPNEEAKVNPYLIVTSLECGASGVIKAGSAWAISALAFGTETIPKVDVIVGPGNIYVTVAKKLLYGHVGIDMIAGPSEILVFADDSADPRFVAADMLSQAEHDPMSASILITTSQDLADKVIAEIKNQKGYLSRHGIIESSLKDYGAIFLVNDIDDGISLINRIAPEHLELILENPWEVLTKIRNAGAVFIGPWTPEPVGDYYAGPNHVLPTMGTARFSSSLSVYNFLKRTSVIHYSRDALLKDLENITMLAEIEGLDAHANSVKIRKQ